MLKPLFSRGDADEGPDAAGRFCHPGLFAVTEHSDAETAEELAFELRGGRDNELVQLVQVVFVIARGDEQFFDGIGLHFHDPASMTLFNLCK